MKKKLFSVLLISTFFTLDVTSSSKCVDARPGEDFTVGRCMVLSEPEAVYVLCQTFFLEGDICYSKPVETIYPNN